MLSVALLVSIKYSIVPSSSGAKTELIKGKKDASGSKPLHSRSVDRPERSETYGRGKFVMPDITKLFPFYVAKETCKTP